MVSAEPLPTELVTACHDVASSLGLSPDWINPGPTQLLDLGLPAGFLQRMERRTYGGLVVHLAARFDQIHFKLYAAVDQGPRSKHFQDLLKLEPRPDELIAAARWARTHDPSDAFRQMLVEALRALNVEAPDDL